MSKIQSSAEHLTLNADGSGNDILFQSNGSQVASISDGGVVTATSFSGSGANLTGISSVGGATGVDFNDNTKARFGTGNDLEIYHDGTHSYIRDGGTGDLRIKGTELSLRSDSADEPYINCTENGAVKLYYDNAVKLETESGGVQIKNNLRVGDDANGIIETSAWVGTATRTVTLTGLHTSSPGNHWDNMTILCWLSGIDGGASDNQSSHWRHTCTALNTWSLGSATSIWGNSPPTISAGTMTTSQIQFTISQSSANAVLRVVGIGYSMGEAKITFS